MLQFIALVGICNCFALAIPKINKHIAQILFLTKALARIPIHANPRSSLVVPRVNIVAL